MVLTLYRQNLFRKYVTTNTITEPACDGSVTVFVVGEGKEEKNRPKRKERGEKKGIFLPFIIKPILCN